MQKIHLRQAGFIRTLIAIFLLVFVGQTVAATTDCETLHDGYTGHVQMESMQDMPHQANSAIDTMDAECCLQTGCDMVNCALMISENALVVADSPDEAYLIYNEQSQSAVLSSLFRPPISL